MKHVFLSYARQDGAPARLIADALGRAGFPVWWDRKIPPGNTWDEVIGHALDTAGCVIVVWSKSSVRSRYVREEAGRAASQGRLIPVLVDKVKAPFGFGLVQAADLAGWRGDEADPRFAQVLEAISNMLGAPAGPALPGTRSGEPRVHRRTVAFWALGVAAAGIGGGAGWWYRRAPDSGYASLHATVTGMRFFEWVDPPEPERSYTSEFRLDSIRYINWELSLGFPRTTRPKDFGIEASWFGPDGNLEWRHVVKGHVDPGRTTYTHWQGWGNANGFESIVPGLHTVVLTIEGAEVARGSFQVLPRTPA